MQCNAPYSGIGFPEPGLWKRIKRIKRIKRYTGTTMVTTDLVVDKLIDMTHYEAQGLNDEPVGMTIRHGRMRES